MVNVYECLDLDRMVSQHPGPRLVKCVIVTSLGYNYAQQWLSRFRHLSTLE